MGNIRCAFTGGCGNTPFLLNCYGRQLYDIMKSNHIKSNDNRRFLMSRKNLIVGQSGGPTAVINSSLYGVVSEGMRHPEAIEHVYGMINGIEGFLNGTVLDFAEALPGEKLDGLKSHPGAYLGSCRYKLPESLEDPVLIQDFLKNLKK